MFVTVKQTRLHFYFVLLLGAFFLVSLSVLLRGAPLDRINRSRFGLLDAAVNTNAKKFNL
jgi:hypothetical protein